MDDIKNLVDISVCMFDNFSYKYLCWEVVFGLLRRPIYISTYDLVHRPICEAIEAYYNENQKGL